MTGPVAEVQERLNTRYTELSVKRTYDLQLGSVISSPTLGNRGKDFELQASDCDVS